MGAKLPVSPPPPGTQVKMVKLSTYTPEAAARKFAKLMNSGEAGSFKAEMFRREYEEAAGEEAYEDFRCAIASVEAYGVC